MPGKNIRFTELITNKENIMEYDLRKTKKEISNDNIFSSSDMQYFPPSKDINKNNYLKLEDAEIYYEVTGKGPAIIFVHGLGGNHISWWQQIPYFSDRYKCINFSHRGFANSKNLSNKIGHEVFAKDLSALIDHLKLDEVYIVAQSMGGWTSLAYIFMKPEKVKAVVMASTSGMIDFKLNDSINREKIKIWEDWSQKEIIKLRKSGILNAIGNEMSLTQPFLSYNYEQIYNLTPYSYKEFIRTDIKRKRVLSPEIMRNIDIPFLFITGDKDVTFPPEGGRLLSSIMPNAAWKNFERTGHSVYFERAEMFNKTVDKFLFSSSGIQVRSNN